MKEIKYRALIKSSKLVGDVELIDFSNQSVVIDSSKYGFDEVELIEYTGLKDQHGVEIFRGDKVKNEKGQWAATIIFKDGAFRVARNVNDSLKHWVLEAQRADKIEVVGSIYETT